MQKAPYVILSLDLLDFEGEKFERIFKSFMGLVEANTLLQEFFFDKKNKGSRVVIKISPNPTLEGPTELTNLLDSDLILRLLSIFDEYFIHNPLIISHTAKLKKEKEKL